MLPSNSNSRRLATVGGKTAPVRTPQWGVAGEGFPRGRVRVEGWGLVMGATAGLQGVGLWWKPPNGIRGRSCVAQQALVHGCRTAIGSCARARPASLDPYPQTLRSAPTSTGVLLRVSCGVPRRCEGPAPPLSTALHLVLLLSPRTPGGKHAEAGPADFRS